MLAWARQYLKAQRGFTGRATLRQTVAFDGKRERRDRKPAERFFTAWRRVPRNGTQEKAGRHFVQNDAGLQNAAMVCVTVRWILKKSQPFGMTVECLVHDNEAQHCTTGR